MWVSPRFNFVGIAQILTPSIRQQVRLHVTIAGRPMCSDFLQANNILILELCNDTSEVVSTILACAILNVVGRKLNHDQIGLLYSFEISGG
jgi:hypothetical protein